MTDDPYEQAEILRKQYESVASKPMKEFEVNDDFFMNNEQAPQTNIEPENGQSFGQIETCLTGVTVAQPFVADCIDMLSAGAAPGPDGIPAKMIKAAKKPFAFMLNDIMKSSLSSGDIPGVLKLAL